MLKRAFHNLIPARAQSALVALLYVFLCTFGMVTHTHAPGDTHGGGIETHASRQMSMGHGQAQAEIGKRTLASSSHCAFCDWQADSQGRVVAFWRFAAPVIFTCDYTRRPTAITRAFSVRSSSRAPPTV